MEFSRRLGLGLVAIAAGLSSMVAAAEASLCPAALPEVLDAAIAQTPLERSYVGMVLQTEGTAAATQQTLYARNANQFFTPASGAKLFTTAAALHRLGANYRIRTSVYGSPGPAGSTNLLVVGRGDPTIHYRQLGDLAEQLAQSGVTRVNQLVLQDAHFPQFATNPTWEWGDAQWYYAPPVNSLILNGNAVTVQVAPTQVGRPLALSSPHGAQSDLLPMDNNTQTVAPQAEAAPLRFWRTGGDDQLRISGELPQAGNPRSYHLAVLNPAERFADVLVRTLEAQGITVAQTEITELPRATPGRELAALESPPLRELITLTNQNSNNLYAEVLLKTLGVTYGDSSITDASTAGGSAIAATLADLGLDPTTVRLADGSGLSRHNLVTPAAMVETLQAMAKHPQAGVFRNSLAVAGINGTLRNRLGGTVLVNRVQGKSGALTGNVSLSGYLQPPDYEPLVFSILINHSEQHARVLRERIDEILLSIAQLSDDC